MLKILLYGSAAEQKILEEALKRPLEEYKISFKIKYLSSLQQLMKNHLLNNGCSLIVACMEGSTVYVIKGNGPDSDIITGTMGFPPTPEEIDDRLMKNPELARFYSSGEYTLTEQGRTRKIPYEDIDYIKSNNKKTIIYLTNGNTETISKNIDEVEAEINRKYFAKCCLGHVVNTRNIYKIHAWDKNSKVLELKSGAEVVLSSVYFDKLRGIYKMAVSRDANLKNLDD